MKRVSVLTLFVLILTALAPGGGAQGRYVLLDRTLAYVGGKVIMESDFQKYLCYMAVKIGRLPSSMDREKYLEIMVDEAIIVEEATRTGIVDIDPRVMEERKELIRKVMKDCDEDCVNVCLDERFQAERAYTELVKEEFIRKRVRLFVNVPEKDIRNYYLSHSEFYGSDFNESVKREIRGKLEKMMIERELSDFLDKVRRRMKIIISGDWVKWEGTN
jgi:hypothetical protein